MQLIEEHLEKPEIREKARFFAEMDNIGFKYREKPVEIEEFILSDRYLNLKESIRPVIIDDMKALFCDHNSFAFCPYEEAVFDEAIGTGKSFKTSIITAYFLHHLACLIKPQQPFKDIDSESMITIMNMSVNATQAKKVVFGEIKQRIDSSPWFFKHRPDPDIRSELRFHGNICVIPANSATTFPLGYNLLVAIMDEAAFYTQTDTSDVAEDMFYTLKRRIETRFGKMGLLVIISSPRYVDDFIEKKMVENDPKIFYRRYAIWEVVPDDIADIKEGRTFELGGTKIPLRYQSDFQKNPEKAWRDLGARPSLALEPYFKQFNLVEECIDEKLYHPFDVGGTMLKGFKPVTGRKYYVHIDLGVRHDACGIAMGHAEDGNAVLDFIYRIKPTKNVEVDITGITDMMFDLQKKGFLLAKVTYDSFQSFGSIQRLKSGNIRSEVLSVENMETWETFKEQLYTGHVRFYRHEIFLNEMRRLEMIQAKKVDHPVHGSKDCADAVCGAVWNIVKYELTRRTATMKVV
ncbi:hypothetical protein ACFL2J_05465 [Candidatus Omnitrophota bacterium]